MAKLKVIGQASAVVDRGMAHLTGDHDTDVETVIDVTLPDGLSDDAIESIQRILNREATRFAQIAAVNLRDQSVALEDAQRLRDVPAERPVIIVSPSNRGENDRSGTNPHRSKPFTDTETAGRLHWRDADGNLIPVDHPKRGADAKKNVEQYTRSAKASALGVPSRKAQSAQEGEGR